MKIFWRIIIIFILAAVIGGFFYYWENIKILPDSPETYEKIFNKNEILDGKETTAREVDQKLDARLNKYRRTFAKIAQTNDQQTLKALFYMNFVRLYGYYGPRTLTNLTLNEMIRKDGYFQCGTFTTFLAMLLDKEGYEIRTVSIDSSNHGFLEVKLDNKWQILDPTINSWINKSFEELTSGSPRTIKKFYLRSDSIENDSVNQSLPTLTAIKDQMFNQGLRGNLKIDQYNYIDLSQYSY